jgi:hypothetical protein
VARPAAELSLLPDEPEPELPLEPPHPASTADAASAAHVASHRLLISVIAYASMAERPYFLEWTLVVCGIAHRHCAGGEEMRGACSGPGPRLVPRRHLTPEPDREAGRGSVSPVEDSRLDATMTPSPSTAHSSASERSAVR